MEKSLDIRQAINMWTVTLAYKLKRKLSLSVLNCTVI